MVNRVLTWGVVSRACFLAAVAVLLAACGGGNGRTHHPSTRDYSANSVREALRRFGFGVQSAGCVANLLGPQKTCLLDYVEPLRIIQGRLRGGQAEFRVFVYESAGNAVSALATGYVATNLREHNERWARLSNVVLVYPQYPRRDRRDRGVIHRAEKALHSLET